MNIEHPFNPDQAAALKKLRLRWFAALLTNLPLPFIALPIAGSDWIAQQPDEQARNAMLLAGIVGVVAILVGLYLRNQAYKAHWRGDVVTPPGYLRGNTLFFAMINGAAAVLLGISLANSYPAPTLAAAPILIGLLAMNWPNGRPMRPAPPRIGEDGGLS